MIVLLGSKVAEAFGFGDLDDFVDSGFGVVRLPHPSGLCRKWHDPQAIKRARQILRLVLPAAIANLIGTADPDYKPEN